MTAPTNCPWCDAVGSVTEWQGVEVFGYRAGDETVTLTCGVTAIGCDACGCQWTDWRGEDARTAAVDAYLAQRDETQ